MMNIRFYLSIIMAVLIGAECLTVCASADAVERNGNIITVTASGEAIASREHWFADRENSMFLEKNFERTRAGILDAGTQTFPAVDVKNRLDRELCDDCEVYSLSDGDCDNIVLYIHGGAWVYGIEATHVSFCDELVDRLNAKVYMPLYPHAPKYTYTDTYKMVLDLYDALLEQGKPVFVMGDSAGGSIALGLVNIIRETGRKMPDKLVLISPCADLTFSEPKMRETEKREPMLAIYGCLECAKMWAGDTELSDPALSAVNCDVSGYPDTIMFVATEDILSHDALKLFDMFNEAGNNTVLVKGEGLYHVFPIWDLPEKEISLELISDFCMK